MEGKESYNMNLECRNIRKLNINTINTDSVYDRSGSAAEKSCSHFNIHTSKRMLRKTGGGSEKNSLHERIKEFN